MHARILPQRLARLVCILLLVAATAVADRTAAQSPPTGEEPAGRARRIDALFAALKTTRVEEEGDAMVAEIWRLWLQSGRPDLDAAMQQATKNADEKLDGLVLERNRLRQAIITKELAEIVGGAEALK